jgi:hypothetical protein
MRYEMKAPPVTATGGNRSYKALLDAVRKAQGEWVAVNRDEIKGFGDPLKRAAIKAAATRAGLVVEVRFSEQRVHVCLSGTDLDEEDHEDDEDDSEDATCTTTEARQIAECLFAALGSPEKHRVAASTTWVDEFSVQRSRERHPYPLDEVLAMINWSFTRPRWREVPLVDLRKVHDPVETLCGREWIDLHQEWAMAQEAGATQIGR